MNRAQRSRPIQGTERLEISARDETSVSEPYYISPELDVYSAGILFNIAEDAYQRRRVMSR